MTVPAPAYQAIYRACIKEAAAQGRTLMQRLVSRGSDAMLACAVASADEIERHVLGEAARRLMKHETVLGEAYPQALLAEIAQVLAGDTRKSSTVTFDALERMGDEQVRENVELVRIQQAVASQVEAELATLDALMAAVQGVRSAQPGRNPLLPQVYLLSLRTVVMQSPIPSPMRTRWLLHLGEALGPELARVYAELAGWMRAQGVVQAHRAAEPSPPAPAPAAPTRLNLGELRRLVTGEFIDSSRTGPFAPTDFGKTMPAAVDALEDMKQVREVVQRMKARQADHARAQPEPAQLLAQEVVGLMIDNIASDARLLPPVQECVRGLEPVLMRLALDDPRFFSDRHHPARRLLDELTQRSLAWESEDSPGFQAFIEPLRQAVDALRATRFHGPEPLDFALRTLEEAWGDVQQQGRHHREAAVRALLNAEQRNLLAGKIAKELRHRPDLEAAPAGIVAFVTGPWAQVIAQARLTDASGSRDPGGFTSLITDLVWSAQPGIVGSQTVRLAKLVPVLVAKIRAGLAMIGYPQDATERFLDDLSHAHHAAPQLSREALEAMIQEGDNTPGAWLAPSEAQQSGFMDVDASLALGQCDEIPELPVDHLQPGAWTEMMTAQGWQRFQVAWASPHGTLFLFTGKDGRPQSMSRRLLAQMLQGGTLRLVSAQPVVDGALDAVAEAALRNTVNSGL